MKPVTRKAPDQAALKFRLLVEEWLLTRGVSCWGYVFLMDEHSYEAADYFVTSFEDFEEWLTHRGDDDEH